MDPHPAHSAHPAHTAHTAHRRASIAIALLVAAAAAALLAARLSHPTLHGDEITYMSSVLESLQEGSLWPLEAGRPFVRKPPLGFWPMRLSFQALGPTPFAARLPAVLATAATAGVLYLLGATWRGPSVGLVAAALFLLLPGPLAEHTYRSATFDALEILLVTSAIACLELWRRRGDRAARWGYLAALALTAWVKSPFGGAVVLAYLVATEGLRRRRGTATPRWRSLVAASLVVWLGAVLLWLGALAGRTSLESVRKRVLGQQYARRIEGQLNPLHVQGPGYYAAGLWRDFGPLLLIPVAASVAARLSRRRGANDGEDRAGLAIWALAAPVLASLSASKLPWYAYASYPGLALLVARDVERLATALGGSRRVRAAALGVAVGWAAWRLPVERIWPAMPRHRGPSACLFEVQAAGAHLVRTGEAGAMPSRRRRARGVARMNPEVREARLFLDAVLWRQERDPRGPTGCVAAVGNRASPGAVVLLPSHGDWGPGIFLVDRCGGRVRERLLAAACGAVSVASTPAPRP